MGLTITAVERQRYSEALREQRDAAEAYVRRRVLDECQGLGVTDARDRGIEVIEDAVSVFGAAIQAVTCDMFDEVVATGSAAGPAPVVFDDLTDRTDIEHNVHYFARKLVDGDLDGFSEDCARRAAFYVWREARLCVATNVGRFNRGR